MTDRALRRWLAPALLAAFLSTACSQPVTGTPVAEAGADRPSTSERSAEKEPVDEPSGEQSTEDPGLEPLVGTWTGEYTCAQGETGLRLVVEPIDDESVRALFEFFPVPENPDAVEGSFQLVGSYRGDRLVFRQEKWIDQPENYLMVDLEVTSPVEPEMDVLSGNVLSTNCKGFSVRRE